jgi:hypothetical protein
MSMRILTASLVFTAAALATALCTTALAQSAGDEALGEATGLEPKAADPAPSSSKVAPASAAGVDAKWRAYGLVDWRISKEARRDGYVTSGPNLEAGAAASADPHPALGLFLEGRALYDEASEHGLAHVDQAGVRLRPMEHTLLVLGKERSRRAPGLIVSPSDFVHTSQSIPGLREERSGTWVARASWQTESVSFDVIALPVSLERETGLPDEDSEYHGTAARLFLRLPGGVDVELDHGRLDDVDRWGAFAQTIVRDIWKLYAESGYASGHAEVGPKPADDSPSKSSLVGLGYEGSSVFALRAEYYERDENWIPASPLLVDEKYAITSLTLLEIRDRFNLTKSYVRSLSTERFVDLTRLDWLASDRQTVGATFAYLEPEQPTRWQGLVDWRLSL